LRTLGLNEVRTYSLISPEDNALFKYNTNDSISLQLPMSADKSIVRQTLIPSLMRVVDYNLARNTKDISIYEISNVYCKKNNEYVEITKLGFAMLGNYITNTWQNNNIKIDFYVIKGIVENILDYFGYANRYKIRKGNNLPSEMHPGISAEIVVDGEIVGYFGAVHPSVNKLPIFVGELNLSELFNKKTGDIKYKENPKFPSITKDMAFIFDKNILVEDIIKVINIIGGKMLDSIEVFDVYTDESLGLNKKSIAFTLTFMDINKTLTDEEVNVIFNNIINELETQLNGVLRNK
jgi:phenylalanyl-tRNA synthetase beta chain